MPQVIISVGSNHSDKRMAVARAISWLTEKLNNSVSSEIYETPDIKYHSRNYCNAVVEGEFNGNIEELEYQCKNYELREGRDDITRMSGIVPIDLDIVIANNTILKPWDYRQFYFRKGLEMLGKKKIRFS